MLVPIAISSRAGATRAGATREQVYAALREAIVTAALEPGRRLSENELAGELGVSRTPVREALALLRDEALVEVVPQLGTFVTRVSERAVADAAFVREALECAAVRRAARRLTLDDQAALGRNLERQAAAAAAHDEVAFDRLDEDLHRLVCRAAGHEVAWTLSRRANGQLDRVRRLSMPAPGYLDEMVAEHRAIVAALSAHDADGAEAALRHHLQMVLALLPRLRRERPEHFDDPEEG